MNYRHAFHAGNFADVVKHAVLVALIESMKGKQTPFAYLDTHAGAGRYNLHSSEAQKTNEHVDGINRLLAATRLPTALHVYLNLVRSLNAKAGGGIVEYPGSPLIASLLMRDNDKLQLCEIENRAFTELKVAFSKDPRVATHHRNGYEAIRALLPPKERRGLVLIDPPFEAQEGEFDAISDALKGAHKRFPTGIFAVWYPIKLRQGLNPFYRFLKQSGMKKVLIAELLLHPDNSALRLNGCGMAIINAPWKFDKTVAEIMPVLQSHLSQGRFGQQKVEWLVGD